MDGTPSRNQPWTRVLVIVAVLLLSIWSGRQLFLDGANFVVQSMLDPFWFPQPTPRRFFAVIWSTGALRLLGLVDTDAVALGTLLFGGAVYALILVPVLAICRSGLDDALRHALLAILLSATLMLANFPVTELLFALAMTTLFTLYTLHPADDPKGWKRLAAAFFLIASYETIILSNIVLVLAASRSEARDGRAGWVRRATLGLLCFGPLFQIGFYLVNPDPSGGGILNAHVILLAALLGGQLLLSLIAIRLFQHRPAITVALAAAAFLLPIALLLLGQGLYLRTRLFQYAYPSRIYTVSLSILIAMAPLLLDQRLWSWPRRGLDWLGGSLRGLSLTMVALFAGTGILSSIDAYRYRSGLEQTLSRLSGIVLDVSACDLCTEPQRFGLPDLGYPWIWTLYSMAHTMRRQDQPAVVLIVPGALTGEDISQAEVERFYAREAARRRPPG